MPYKNFTNFPLWQAGADLADSIFDFSRGIEDFSLRNRMTAAAVDIPFLLGEAAQSESDEAMANGLWKVEDPINELRSVLNEAKEQGLAPHADYALMLERCRDLFQKVHSEASSPTRILEPGTTPAGDDLAEPASAPPADDPAPDDPAPPPVRSADADEEDSGPAKRKTAAEPGDLDFDENALI